MRELAERFTESPLIYLATMYAGEDPENQARIAHHRESRRDQPYQTLEKPWAIDTLQLPADSLILLEDLGNLVANTLFLPEARQREPRKEEYPLRLDGPLPTSAGALSASPDPDPRYVNSAGFSDDMDWTSLQAPRIPGIAERISGHLLRDLLGLRQRVRALLIVSNITDEDLPPKDASTLLWLDIISRLQEALAGHGARLIQVFAGIPLLWPQERITDRVS